MVIKSFQGSYRFLSNFWFCKIKCNDGITYPSVEHAFQAAKSRSLSERKRMSEIERPGDVILL